MAKKKATKRVGKKPVKKTTGRKRPHAQVVAALKAVARPPADSFEALVRETAALKILHNVGSGEPPTSAKPGTGDRSIASVHAGERPGSTKPGAGRGSTDRQVE